MAVDKLKFFSSVTGFLDTEIALAIKPTPKNMGKMLTQSIGLKYVTK